MLGRQSFPTENGFFFKGHGYPAGNEKTYPTPPKGEVGKIINSKVSLVGDMWSFPGGQVSSTIHTVTSSHPAFVRWDLQGPARTWYPLGPIFPNPTPNPESLKILIWVPKGMGPIVSPIIGGLNGITVDLWYFPRFLLDLGKKRFILGVYFGLYGSSKDRALDHFGPAGWWVGGCGKSKFSVEHPWRRIWIQKVSWSPGFWRLHPGRLTAGT